MKYLALLLSLAAIGLAGCQQTPQIPEQYEPAFASDDFGADVRDQVETRASGMKSSFKERASSFKSAMQKEVTDLKDDVNEFRDVTADQFEPLDE